MDISGFHGSTGSTLLIPKLPHSQVGYSYHAWSLNRLRAMELQGAWQTRFSKHKIDRNLRDSENVQLQTEECKNAQNAQLFFVFFIIVIVSHRVLDKALKYYMQLGQKHKFQLHCHYIYHKFLCCAWIIMNHVWRKSRVIGAPWVCGLPSCRGGNNSHPWAIGNIMFSR